MTNLRPLAPNFTVANVNGAEVFYSYETPVALRHNGRFVRTAKRYSVTTTNQVNKHCPSAQTIPANEFDDLLNNLNKPAETENPPAGLVAAAADSPGNVLILADWLEENGNPDQATALRNAAHAVSAPLANLLRFIIGCGTMGQNPYTIPEVKQAIAAYKELTGQNL